MNKQLTDELIQIAQEGGYYEYLCWGKGITNLDQVDFIQRHGVEVSQVIIDFLNNASVPAIPETGSTLVEGYSLPIFAKLNVSKLKVGNNIKFELLGDYFAPENTVKIAVGEKEAEITSNWLGANKILVEADLSNYNDGDKLDVYLNEELVAAVPLFVSNWFDFREGGAEITNYDLEKINENQIVRDANGIGTSNTANSWGKLLGLTDFAVPRDHKDGLQIVFYKQNLGSCMFGMIASEHGVDTSMYNETSVGAYAQNQNLYFGFYSFKTRRNQQNIVAYDRLKLVIVTDMNPGSKYKVYGLKPDDDWDCEDYLIDEGVIPNGTQDPGDKVYPCLTPNNGVTARLQAFNLFYN